MNLGGRNKEVCFTSPQQAKIQPANRENQFTIKESCYYVPMPLRAPEEAFPIATSESLETGLFPIEEALTMVIRKIFSERIEACLKESTSMLSASMHVVEEESKLKRNVTL